MFRDSGRIGPEGDGTPAVDDDLQSVPESDPSVSEPDVSPGTFGEDQVEADEDLFEGNERGPQIVEPVEWNPFAAFDQQSPPSAYFGATSSDDAPSERPEKTVPEQVEKPASEQVEEPASEQSSDLVKREAKAFERDTFQAFAECFAEVVADAHGLGLAWTVAKWVWGTAMWLQVAEDRGGVAVPVPLPLGVGTVLEANVRLGDRDTPLTLSVAPGGASGVGALTFKGLEIDPAPRHASSDMDGSQASPERYGPVEIIPWQSLAQRSANIKSVAAAARRQAQEDLLSGVWRRRQQLQEASVDLVVGYDAETRQAVWVNLSGADGLRSWDVDEGKS